VKQQRVNKNTRAGKNGKCIQCPDCGHKAIVYHFAWGASTCGWQAGGCDRIVEKNDWLVVG
jgi:ribosomal protein S27E|tara:strand:+ start:1517 stop:1699 length:183 start_codon:yes stop_codon:yes gene_type:complete